jgi:hypothetical protein
MALPGPLVQQLAPVAQVPSLGDLFRPPVTIPAGFRRILQQGFRTILARRFKKGRPVMKKDRQKKLMLNRETLKSLTPEQLAEAAGGLAENPFPSMCSCCITECCC